MNPPDKTLLERQRYNKAQRDIAAITPEALRVIAWAFGSDSDDKNLREILFESNEEIHKHTLKRITSL